MSLTIERTILTQLVSNEEYIEKDLTLKFEYDIVSTNNLPAEWFGEEFFNLIGDILVDILDQRMKEGTLEYVTND